MTRDQEHAFRVFEKCAELAWTGTTSEPWNPEYVNELARLVVVWTFDPDGADSRVMVTIAEMVAAPGQSRALLAALLNLCSRWMAERGGADSGRLRLALMQEHVSLAAPPLFTEDIGVLQKHSREIAQELERYESIDWAAGNIKVARECQGAVLLAAEQQSVLLIGEPGAGKSAVINALARELRQKGDVIELAVDRYNVESLDDLRVELGLQNSLVNVIEAWDGPTDGWLIIDALDATRGGRGEGAFRSLIERVLALKGRWKVVASIRTFDLRMGIRFRELFPGQAPDAGYRDPTFPNVRHVLVPAWSEHEFKQVLVQAPELATALAGAPTKLQHLAEVPFNTRLIYELLQNGVVAETLRSLGSQAHLLHLFWDYRVLSLGVGAEACLRQVVQTMLDARMLRSTAQAASATNSHAFDELCHRGVLIRVENDRYVQFRHHLLFDYVASRLLLDPDAITSGRMRFPKAEAKGLMLAPALGFLLQELWASETDRSRYWTAVEQIIGDKEGDPVLRSAAGRLSAELPEVSEDSRSLAQHVMTGDVRALTALGHVVAALAVRLEDDSDVFFNPWVTLAGAIADNVERVSHILRFLTHLLVNAAKPPQLTVEVGKAARALLRDSITREVVGGRAASLIPLVVATFSTDPTESTTLLDKVFDPTRAATHRWEDVPALCREIKKLAQVAPGFVAQVYSNTYAGSVNSDVVTRLGESKILSLTSNAGQDYSMALYSLSEYFPDFLSGHPAEAVDALVGAVDAYISREHANLVGAEGEVVPVSIDGRILRLKSDGSHIWAHDPDSQYGQDGEALIAKFTKALIALPETAAVSVANYMLSRIESAIFWARLFLAAVRRQDSLVDLLWPIAASGSWLTLSDTRKDAIDVVAAGYSKRTPVEKQALEQMALTFDTSGYMDPVAAKEAFLGRLFNAVGADQLVTNEARMHVTSGLEETHQNNERIFRVDVRSIVSGAFDWIRNLDRSLPCNASMITAIEAARDYLGESGQPTKHEVETSRVFDVLEPVAQCLLPKELNIDLRRMGEGIIGQACALLAEGERLVCNDEESDPADRFLSFLRIAVESENPTVDDETEAQFEKSQAWGSPAPRVEAAVAALDVCLSRPELYARLGDDIDRLLGDQHPATRLQAATHLIRIWDIDRESFWTRLDARFRNETNFGVLSHLADLLRRVLHADHDRTESQLLVALQRFDGTVNHARIVELTADIVAILAITYSSEAAVALQSRWIGDPVSYVKPLRKIIATLRGAIALGLRPGEPDDSSVRHRAQAVLHQIVLSANGVLINYDPRVEVPTEQVDAFRACMDLLDSAGSELYFATGRAGGEIAGLSNAACTAFLAETAETIERIGDRASPHTIYYLMQLIEILAPYDAAKAFDLTVHAIRSGGVEGGYHFESLGADLMVRMVGTFLADNKEIFENETRRKALVDCLEIFMDAGWTAARRLLYRLPELIQ
ncbi:ATP-binding protein [Janthinobacterium agaricidamnosum]|uniref:ATP-binding protein n=1 Tax=Janthinobacterium agaricidamnosum TaxID=55508 RepID=UPI00068D75CB|nr:ATP-binding protein [Janthinobacterium agaricidamnosum]